jgi:hypothetical protein
MPRAQSELRTSINFDKNFHCEKSQKQKRVNYGCPRFAARLAPFLCASASDRWFGVTTRRAVNECLDALNTKKSPRRLFLEFTLRKNRKCRSADSPPPNSPKKSGYGRAAILRISPSSIPPPSIRRRPVSSTSSRPSRMPWIVGSDQTSGTIPTFCVAR